MKKEIFLLCVVGIFLLGCTAESNNISTNSNPNYKEISLVASNWKFTPNVIEVKKGENIKLKIKSTTGTHGIAIPDLNVKTGRIGPGEEKTVTFTANKVGSFPFRCNIYCGSGHKTMTGRLIVK